jgi:hypothetical protein
MKQLRKMPLFEIKESGYHESAKNILAKWVGGIIEVPFKVDGKTLFIPDVTVYENELVKCVYEIVYSHPLTVEKSGKMQYYCYRNFTSLTVYEISADFILKQTCKPECLEFMECYTIDLFEYEQENGNILINFL